MKRSGALCVWLALSAIYWHAPGAAAAGFLGDGGPAVDAILDSPEGTVQDTLGNLYIADCFTNRVRKVDAGTGIITTVAGSGTSTGFNSGSFSGDGGPATSATMNCPVGVAFDAGGNLFIGDIYNHRIRRVDGGTGIITTVAGSGPPGCCSGTFSGDGGPATSAGLAQPSQIAFDTSGDLYFTDAYNHRVRKIDTTSGIITTVAGSGPCCGAVGSFSGDGGPATSATFHVPVGLAFDATGNLFVGDQCNHRVRRIDAITGIITTFAGSGPPSGPGGCAPGTYSGDGGPATAANLNFTVLVHFDAAGNLYVGDHGNHRVRRVDAGTGIITTVAGTGAAGFSGDGGPAISAKLNGPHGGILDGAGNLFISDAGNDRIRKVDGSTGIITTIAGGGTPPPPGDTSPPQVSFTRPINRLYVADRQVSIVPLALPPIAVLGPLTIRVKAIDLESGIASLRIRIDGQQVAPGAISFDGSTYNYVWHPPAGAGFHVISATATNGVMLKSTIGRKVLVVAM